MTLPLILALCALSAAGLAWSLFTVFSGNAASLSDAYESEVGRTLDAMFLFVPAKRLLEIGWAIALTVFFLTLLPFCLSPEKPWLIPLGLCVALPLGLLGFQSPKFLVRRLRERRRERFTMQLLEALPMMSNALRAGFSVTQAFETVARELGPPMNQEISLFLRQLHVGMGFSEALQELDARMACEDLTLVCTAIDIARRSGGNLTEIFDAIVETIRGRLRIHQHIKTLTAQGRLQGIVIGAMPFLLAIGMTVFKPGLMLPFICSVTGVLTLVSVTVFVALGGWMIRKIVAIDV